MIDTAIQYAKRGFFVLPLTEDKKPLIKFANKPPLTEQDIRDVWGRYLTAQIGLRTVQFFVVDVDTKDEHGSDGYKSIERLNLPDTLTQKTPSGGKQLFYRKPKNVLISQNIGLLPGVDIKAQNNNYVMVAPSVRNGKAYEWVNKLPMNEPSKELIELITKNKPDMGNQLSNFDNTVRIKKYTGKLLDEIVTGTTTGNRNDWLTRIMAKLLNSGAELRNIYYLMIVINENFIDSPLSTNEVNKVFTSMLNKERRNEAIE